METKVVHLSAWKPPRQIGLLSPRRSSPFFRDRMLHQSHNNLGSCRRKKRLTRAESQLSRGHTYAVYYLWVILWRYPLWYFSGKKEIKFCDVQLLCMFGTSHSEQAAFNSLRNFSPTTCSSLWAPVIVLVGFLMPFCVSRLFQSFIYEFFMISMSLFLVISYFTMDVGFPVYLIVVFNSCLCPPTSPMLHFLSFAYLASLSLLYYICIFPVFFVAHSVFFCISASWSYPASFTWDFWYQ